MLHVDELRVLRLRNREHLFTRIELRYGLVCDHNHTFELLHLGDLILIWLVSGNELYLFIQVLDLDQVAIKLNLLLLQLAQEGELLFFKGRLVQLGRVPDLCRPISQAYIFKKHPLLIN